MQGRDLSRRECAALTVPLLAAAALYADLGLARFRTFHNETFDLALYARMAWGLLHGNFWDPVVGAPYPGIHLAFVVAPLAPVGALFGYAETLLVAQAAMALLAAVPLARLAARRLGPGAAVPLAAAWALHPNLGHVLSAEFHPGTCAVLPLLWAFDAADRRAAKELFWAALLTVACREDLALVVLMLALPLRSDAQLGLTARRLLWISAAYFALFAFVLVPVFGPKDGSAELHFGKWGGSLGGIVTSALLRPGEVIAHVFAPERRGYWLELLGPLLFLPLLAPKVLLAAAPLLAVNLLSEWPTATSLREHYQTVLLPVLFAAAVHGAAFLLGRRPLARVPGWLPAVLLLGALATAHGLGGGTPLSPAWDRAPFVRDARGDAAARAVAHIPAGASVQAPYALMPHLAGREYVRKPPPPDKNTRFVILDGAFRDAHAGSEDLIRTDEEPVLRDWLAKPTFGLIAREGPFYVLERGARVREGLGAPYLGGPVFPDDGVRVAGCLRLRGASLDGDALTLRFGASGPCPSDLALKLGCAWDPVRVDLPFGGELSPAWLVRGDEARSTHRLSEAERACLLRGELRLGAIRSSGARPEITDPVSVPVPLR